MTNINRHQSEAGVMLVGVMLLLIVVTAFAGSMFSITLTNQRSLVDAEQSSMAKYIARSALSNALVEVTDQDDIDGDGLGAMGVTTPIPYVDSTGAIVGEWKTVVDASSGTNVLLAVAAVPNFTNATYLSSLQAVLSAEVAFTLTPQPAAVAIAGPLTAPTFPSARTSTVHIDGGEKPALTISTEDGFDALMYALGDLMDDGDIDSGSLLGGESSTFEHDTLGEIELPVAYGEASFLSAAELNEYRNTLRDNALSLADSADLEFDTKITGDQTWGTEGNPVVVSIDADAIGKDRVFDTEDQTITGFGTLIIQHTVRPRKNLNLNWTGDIYVIGFDGDGNDLLYLYGTEGTINGNLILLSSDATEASLEMRESSSSYVGSSDKRGADLTVNGSLLTLAEANSHEAEVEVERKSTLTVNGLLGLFGSRIEIEASSSSATLTVNGSLSVGMAQDLEADFTRTDDFELQMRGQTSITYDEDLLNSALEGLDGIEAQVSSGGGTPSYNSFSISGVMGSTASPHTVLVAVEGMISGGGEVGVDMDSF